MLQWFTRARSRDNLKEIDARRICLIKPSALGDVVQALPVLSALRGRFPRAHIAWVVNRTYADLLVGHPHLNAVISFERHRSRVWSRAARKSVSDLMERLKAERFDLVCDLQGLLRSGLMTRATGARWRVGLGDSREGARFFYSDVVAVPADDLSAVDRYWLMAEALGAASDTKRFLVPVDVSDREWAANRLTGLDGTRVAIHPGARWVTKRWPVEHFAEVARRLDRETDARLVLVGGPEEMDTARQIESAVFGRCVNLVGQTSLKQLAAALASVHLVLTNDSGPMHLAAAVGTPVAGIFTCTSPQRARPYGPGHLILSSNLWCRASYLKNCSRLECMTELTPDRVWPAIREKVESLRTQAAA